MPLFISCYHHIGTGGGRGSQVSVTLEVKKKKGLEKGGNLLNTEN
jgi:hypothetical protein